MSWSLEFINWDESNGGTAIHTISTDIYKIKLDPEKITGQDYYKQESRICKVTLLNDNSDFIKGNMIDDMKVLDYEYGHDSSFWEYAVRLKKDGDLVFTGWVKISSFDYNKKTDIMQFTISDILSVIVANTKHQIGVDSETKQFTSFLENGLSKSIGHSKGYGFGNLSERDGFDDYGLTITNNYTFDSGIEGENLEIVISDDDFDVTNWSTFNDPVLNDFWYNSFFYIDPTIYGVISGEEEEEKTVLNISSNEDGIAQLTLMKYNKRKFTGTQYGSAHYYFQQKLSLLKCYFDDNFIPYSFSNEVHFNDTFSSSEEAIVNAQYSEESYYNNNYVDKDYPLINSLSYDIDDDNRIYFIGTDPITIYYDGTMIFTEVTITGGYYNYMSLIKMLLMINNLVLKVSKEGNLEIINKDDYNGETVIDDDYVFEFKTNAVLHQEPDYSSILSPLTSSVESIETSLRDYYKDTIPQYEYYVEIENKYDLSLNDKIVVYDKNMQIVEIEKDLDDFYYTIKAWSVIKIINPLDAGLVFDMPMTTDYMTGALLTDLIGGNNGTASGDPVIGANYTTFDGDDTFTIPSSFNSTFVGDFTISCWVKPTDGQPKYAQYFFGDYIDASGKQYFTCRPDGTIKYSLQGNSDFEYITTDSAVFPDGTTSWTHFTITGNQAITELKMYTNGTLEPTTTGSSITSANWALYNSTTNQTFLGEHNDTHGAYTGNMAHFRIWNRVLTTAERTLNYNLHKKIYQ